MSEQQTIDEIFDTPEPEEEPVQDATPKEDPPAETLGLKDEDLDAIDADQADPTLADDPEMDQAGQEAQALDAKALAEKLGIDIEEVYGMQFKYGDGESMTLGELKDLGTRAKTIDVEHDALETERVEFENLNMTARQELNNLVAMLPREAITSQMIEAAKNQFDTVMKTERKSLLTVLPSWQEPAIEDAAKGAMFENLQEYGFKQQEFDMMQDHRLVKLIHDYTRLRARLKPAVEKVKAFRKTGNKRAPAGGKKSDAAYQKAKQLGSMGNSRGAIDALFEG